MNTNKLLQTMRSGWSLIVVIAVATLAIIAISIYYLDAGYFIIFQNLFYIPIIIACVYYTKRGFAFSVIIACLYFLLIIAFTRESLILLQAFVRALIFVLVAGVITFLSLERNRKEEALHQSEYNYRLLFESAGEGILIAQGDMIKFANPALEKILGYPRNIITTKPFASFIHPDDRAMLVDRHMRRMSGEPYRFRSIAADGTQRWLHIISRIISWDGMPASLSFVMDITDHKHAEDELRASEEKYRSILETMQEGYFEVDLAGNFTFVNNSTCLILGYSKDEMIGMNNRQYTDQENSKKLFQTFNEVYNTGKHTEGFDWQIIKKDGTKRYIEASVSLQKDSSGKPIGFRGIVRDITERKQADGLLRESEERFRSVVEKSSVGIAIVNDKFLCTYVNKECCNISGYSEQELVGINFTSLLAEESKILATERYQSRQRGEDVPSQYEFIFVQKNGEKRTGEVRSAVYLDSSDKVKSLIQVIDITERKKADEALKNSEAKYRDIFENAMEGIYQSTMDGRFITANAAFAKMAGYDSPEELIDSIKDIGTQLYVHPEDRKILMEIRDAKGFVEGFEVEFYKKDGSVFWVVINARTVKDEQGKILCIEGLAEDITIRKRAEEQLQQTLESLRKAVGTTIQVMVSAVEMRDPYTSGHQLRSAKLARAIATEMGLPQEKIEGIRMAGSIHDIGKLSIPAELLSKPTKLTDIEFSLIKEHSRIGYEVLKDVESSWPLAQIVYQHHERMNGSGYPRNLKGDEILMEARVMAVADVVEAMASHRPYRSSLGIDAALAEIEKNRGTLYDNTVSDTCLRLFREKGYQLT